jgi:hypothetical protein
LVEVFRRAMMQTGVWLVCGKNKEVYEVFWNRDIARDSVRFSYHKHPAKDTLEFVEEVTFTSWYVSGVLEGTIKWRNVQEHVQHV